MGVCVKLPSFHLFAPCPAFMQMDLLGWLALVLGVLFALAFPAEFRW